MPRSPLAADPLTTPLPSCKDWQPSRADACAPLPPGYQPRDVESSPLHQAIRLHRAAFVDEVHRGGHVLPAVVTRELDGFLACGVLAHGFARVRCSSCGHELLVPFSCKRRGICPSCTARRAENTAAHLVDRVLPRAPYRQWVFTFPIAVRLALSPEDEQLTIIVAPASARATTVKDGGEDRRNKLHRRMNCPALS